MNVGFQMTWLSLMEQGKINLKFHNKWMHEFYWFEFLLCEIGQEMEFSLWSYLMSQHRTLINKTNFLIGFFHFIHG